MMVNFISQCEKKALSRTRRVLDAFANRIGNKTWQTAITEDGLTAVKKLLRKTASKNTAVACHWIRSRSRSELVWVVGNKSKYNEQGLVPVNYTEKPLIMEYVPMKTKNILANVKLQPLSQHLFAVGYIACCLIKKMNIENPKLSRAAFIAGILHDLGKIDPQFQSWLCGKIKKTPDEPTPIDGLHIDKAKFSFETHPRHHEISWMLSELLLADDSLNKSQRQQIAHGIYWHHTRPFRKDDQFNELEAIFSIFKKSLKETTFDKNYEIAVAVLKDIAGMVKCHGDVADLMPKINYKFSDIHSNSLPKYKKYNNCWDQLEEYKGDVKENALNNLIRTAVISADRKVSDLSAEDLADYIAEGSLSEILDNMEEDSNLSEAIKMCLAGFENHESNSDRNHSQSIAASSLAKLQEFASINDGMANIGVLQGPAGCGKTKIALEWAEKTNAKKIIWVCPRVQVCLGLLNDLTQPNYLPESRIEIFTGEYKKILCDGITFEDAKETDEDNYFSGDIVITTIDQVINALITHKKITTMVDLMQAHVIFDEFHELILMPAFNLLFAELIETKRLQRQHANTLLVSATPNYYFVKNFLGMSDDDIISVKSFNPSKYQINFISYDETQENENPLINTNYSDKTFVITNTAQDAQIGFLRNHYEENSILMHSKYTRTDKVEWFNKVFECFKEEGNNNYDVLRSGPIIQASLNISCDNMLTDLTNAENWLQRLGRLDRFGTNSFVNQYTTVIPQSAENGKQTSSCARYLNQLDTWRSTKVWLDFLKDKLERNAKVTLNQLYIIYADFYADDKSQKVIGQDLLSSLLKGVNLINEKLMDPITLPPKTKRQSTISKIARTSLRGDSRFVQMAVCNIDKNLKLTFTNEYAYPEDVDHSTTNIGLTKSIESMRGYGDSEKDLVVFMKAKHHNIKKDSKKAYKDSQLINNARSPEHPIYLSYTPADLDLVGGINVAHSHAIYYVICEKQPIGAMSINQLPEQDFKK